MKTLATIFLLVISNISNGDTLRISEVATAGGQSTERMILSKSSGEEVFFVKTEVVVGDSDIEKAWTIPGQEGQISVSLNAKGAKKLTETTTRMNFGEDRLAIIVEGRLIAAPIVNSILTDSFEITGLGLAELNPLELDNLARKISGLPPRAEGQEPNSKMGDSIQTVPYTEEEYQRNKEQREKMGIFHIESVPSEEQLNQVLQVGMSREEVLRLLGKPGLSADDSYFIYSIAPEKRPENASRKMIPNGIKVDFAAGKLSRWSHTYSNETQERKVLGLEEPTLQAIFPELDLTSDDADLVAFLEGISIPNPNQPLNRRDLSDLISLTMMITSFPQKIAKEDSLDSNSDFMVILARHFPEAAMLRQNAKQGRVTLKDLNAAVSPYVFGKKQLPDAPTPAKEKEEVKSSIQSGSK